MKATIIVVVAVALLVGGYFVGRGGPASKDAVVPVPGALPAGAETPAGAVPTGAMTPQAAAAQQGGTIPQASGAAAQGAPQGAAQGGPQGAAQGGPKSGAGAEPGGPAATAGGGGPQSSGAPRGTSVPGAGPMSGGTATTGGAAGRPGGMTAEQQSKQNAIDESSVKALTGSTWKIGDQSIKLGDEHQMFVEGSLRGHWTVAGGQMTALSPDGSVQIPQLKVQASEDGTAGLIGPDGKPVERAE